MTDQTINHARRLRRFFIPASLQAVPEGSSLELHEDETSHLRKVLRLGTGDSCLVTDGKGYEATAMIVAFSAAGRAQLRVLGVRKPHAKKGPVIRVYPAMIQKAKIEYLVEKAQELEIEGMTPMETSRSIVKMAASESEKAMKRWQKLACEAAKQSGSLYLIEISKPVKFKTAFADAPGRKIVFHPSDKNFTSTPFNVWLKTVKPEDELSIFFGPEGGFTDEEINSISKNADVVQLTETVLKADTAMLGVLAGLRFLFS